MNAVARARAVGTFSVLASDGPPGPREHTLAAGAPRTVTQPTTDIGRRTVTHRDKPCSGGMKHTRTPNTDVSQTAPQSAEIYLPITDARTGAQSAAYAKSVDPATGTCAATTE